MTVNKQEVFRALSLVKLPGSDRNILNGGVVEDIQVGSESVHLKLSTSAGDERTTELLDEAIRKTLAVIDGIETIEISRTDTATSQGGLDMYPSSAPKGTAAREKPDLLPDVRQIIAVASGKGGVGKSTVAVNLAVSMAKAGMKIGLLDADIYGPSIPLMLGADENPEVDEANRCLLPIERYGVRLMSLGFLVDPAVAVIWRGPMVMKALEQLLTDVGWGELDVMIIDLPPGTGDAQLTIAQKLDLSGAIIVTTPQDVALADATRGVSMFQRVDVPVLGIVENMSYFACPHCEARTDIFGHGGGKLEAEKQGVPFLGDIPIDSTVRAGGDAGKPVVVQNPDSPPAIALEEISGNLIQELSAMETK